MLAWLSRPAAWTEMPAVSHGRGNRAAWPSCFWCCDRGCPPKQLMAISISLLLGTAGPLGLELANPLCSARASTAMRS